MTLIEFTSGTKAKSSEINANFQELDGKITTLGSDFTAFVKKDGTVDFTKAQSYAKHTITGASNATPIVITSTAHGRTNGDVVLIKDIAGNTAANGTWVVANKTDNTYQLAGSVGNGAYISGGTGYLIPQDYENLVPKALIEADKKIKTHGAVSTGFTLTANKFETVTAGAALTLTLPTVTTTDELVGCILELTSGSTPYAITQPTGVKWDNGAPPVTPAASSVYTYKYRTYNGTTWRASWSLGGA